MEQNKITRKITCRQIYIKYEKNNNEYIYFAKHTNINFMIQTHGNVKRKLKYV